ncbi:DUF4255 domain-containing protein [Aerosakkonema sp. BLCC-F183]|uniref:DUF4255 domain-containing protein n=1 Tax=Aerosakkonema sp. BLCC-F183 TaxID=3342834 RepID=UPI0035B8491A
MFQDLDKTLEELIKKELPKLSNGDSVTISFAASDNEFASSVQQLTINLFLYDIRENLELRSNEWAVERQSNGNGIAHKYPPPVRVDCSYLITVWSKTKEIQDEHRYLGEVMKVLMRYPKIPNEFLQGSLKGKEPPLRTSALRPPQSQNWAEFWQAMGGKPKAILNYTVTIALDVHKPVEAGRLVQESLVNYSQLVE